MIEFILAILVGILAGTFTGLAPGIHINLIAAFLVASLSKISFLSPLAAACFIIAMTVTHVFLDFIPSVFLGVPEEDTFLSLLPSQELMHQGKGHEAALLLFYGALIGLTIFIIATPLYITLLPKLYPLLQQGMPYILIAISIYMIAREQQIIPTAITFTLAGFLGLATFSLPVREPLLPLLTGLFGGAGMLISLKSNTIQKPQRIVSIKESIISGYELKRATFAAFIAAPFCSFLPGIGSGHAATIGSEIVPQERKGFLVLTGAISMSVSLLSFVTLYTINRSRSGSAAAIQDLLPKLTLQNILLFILVSIVVALIAFAISVSLTKKIVKSGANVNYHLTTKLVLLFLVILIFFVSGWMGLIVAFTATALGIFTSYNNIQRIQLMGALIVPTILYYLLV